MKAGSVTSTLWRTSVSSYLRTLLRLGLGLVTFRLLFQSLSPEDFGFWALLWSVFGYGVLIDFGLGFATQKRVAELVAHARWDELSRVLSTVLVSFCGLAVVIFVAACFGTDFALRLLNVTPENLPRYRDVTLLFFGGMALGFPLGLFPEILRGLQRVETANLVASVSLVANFLLVVAAVQLGWGLKALVPMALACTLGQDLVCGLLALRLLPEVRLRLRLFETRIARETMQFSIFAYLITATNLILGKSDQLVLGAMLSVASVAVYTAGAKVAEIFALGTKQLQETLSPAAAKMQATGDTAGLRELLLQGTRLSLLVALPAYALFALRLPEFMRLLTGSGALPDDAWWTGQLLLAWTLSTVATNAASKRIFIMTGHERRLLWIGVIEAVANLGCTIGLLWLYPRVSSAALGSLIPGALLGWLVIWPWAAREAGSTSFALFQFAVRPALLAAVPVALVLGGLGFVPHPGAIPPTLVFLVECGLATAAGLAGVVAFGLSPEERAALTRRLRRTPAPSTP